MFGFNHRKLGFRWDMPRSRGYASHITCLCPVGYFGHHLDNTKNIPVLVRNINETLLKLFY